MPAPDSPPVSLRPVVESDLPFLERVYADSRAEELALVDWDEATKGVFLHQQFEAQHRHYREQYVGADLDIILVDGEPAGRQYLWRTRDEIRVMDIALLREFRGRGIGTTLLRAVLAEGWSTGHPVTLHVEVFNPARRLYERLGFRLVEDKGVYLFLEGPPTAAAAAAAGFMPREAR